MSDTQSARLLMSAKPTVYSNETLTALVYVVVVPFMRLGLITYLRQMEENLSWTTPAIQQANLCHVRSVETSYNFYSNSSSSRTRRKCTATQCFGPHRPSDCFAKPGNEKRRAEWIARKEQLREQRDEVRANTAQSQPTPSIVGMRDIVGSPALYPSNDILSLHVSLNLIECEPSSTNKTLASPALFGEVPTANIANSSSGDSDWALHDTGATHHIFNDIKYFIPGALTKNDNQSKRLNLAGGSASLAVHSVGRVRLLAGDRTAFELNDCLYVPELDKHLIAGGLLKRKGVREVFSSTNANCFSLVLGTKALFNGLFSTNNLMIVKLDPMRVILSPAEVNTLTTALTHKESLHHRRLGHVSNKYLSLMKRKNLTAGVQLPEGCVNGCEVCALSKGQKIPHSLTRPRASCFLENVHVDLSGIFRTRAHGGEMYYALFFDNYLSYRHIYGLKDKTKESVFQVFKNYIAVAERQTCQKLKQFTLDNGSELIKNLLTDEL